MIVGGVRGVITRGLRQGVLGVGNMGIPGYLGSFRSKMVFSGSYLGVDGRGMVFAFSFQQ